MAARIRTGNAVGLAVSLVIFVVLFVVSLVAAILFYTQIGAAKLEAATYKKENERFLKSAEKAKPEIEAAINAAAGGSVVGGLVEENQKLKRMVIGDPQASIDLILKEKDSIGLGEGQLFVAEVKRLNTEMIARDNQIKELEATRDQSRKHNEQLYAEMVTRSETYSQTEKELQDKLTALSQQHAEYEKVIESERKKLEDRLSDMQFQYQKTAAELNGVIEQQKQQIVLVQARIEQFTHERTGPKLNEEYDPTLQPDGEILADVPDQNLVYINRGRADHITLGISFAVYDKNAKVTKDQFNELMGKATIEVIHVSEHESTARIVRLERGQAIREGDLIANIAYDANVTYKFYVYGDFDLDNTGQASNADRKRIESMVSDWGGKASDQLNYQTDFLILGQEPKLPDDLEAGVISPVLLEQHAQARRRYEDYQRMVTEAKELKIPILSQNRFLAMVGYYQR